VYNVIRIVAEIVNCAFIYTPYSSGSKSSWESGG